MCGLVCESFAGIGFGLNVYEDINRIQLAIYSVDSVSLLGFSPTRHIPAHIFYLTGGLYPLIAVFGISP